ncbi:MAG: glycoside hydrolase family 32 protein [Clostridiaceae bacterium]
MDKKKQADEFIKDNKDKVNKCYRMKYHFMGQFGWINDPNGFNFYKGQYHLFYQHYPYDSVWGPMHWGHAKSKDLVKWEYLPIALAPDEEYDKDGCFSGTSIEERGELYLYYTGHKYLNSNKTEYEEVQCIAHSKNGIDFEKLKCNPIINENRQDFRDPKVIKHENFYYMFVGSNEDLKKGQILLYKSSDKFNFKFFSVALEGDGTLGDNFECPDYFKIQDKEVMIISPQFISNKDKYIDRINTPIYSLGNMDFDEGKFVCEEFHPVDCGFNFYAPQTMIDDKNRRILIGWMASWDSVDVTNKYKHLWSGAMTFPREVLLKNGKLLYKPIDEIKNYRKNTYEIKELIMSGEKTLDCVGDSYDTEIIIDSLNAENFGIKIRVSLEEETCFEFDKKTNCFIFNRDNSGIGPKGQKRLNLDLDNNILKLRILVDKCSVEVFINDGCFVMTGLIYPKKNSNRIKLFSDSPIKIIKFEKWDI